MIAEVVTWPEVVLFSSMFLSFTVLLIVIVRAITKNNK